MYTIKQISLYNFHVYLHEDCVFNIEKVARDELARLSSRMGPGEYVIRNDSMAEIAIYH